MSAPAVKAVPPPAGSQPPKVASPGGPSASPGKITQGGSVLSLIPSKPNAVPNTNHSGILNLVAEHKNAIPPTPQNATPEPQALVVTRPQEKEKDLSKEVADKKEKDKEPNKKTTNSVEIKEKVTPVVTSEGTGQTTTKVDAEPALVNHTVAEGASSPPSSQPLTASPPTATAANAPPTPEQPSSSNSQSRTGGQQSAFTLPTNKKAEVTAASPPTTTVAVKVTTAPSVESGETAAAVNHIEPTAAAKPSPPVETAVVSSSPSAKVKPATEPKEPKPSSQKPQLASATVAKAVTSPQKAEKENKENDKQQSAAPKGVKRKREVKEARPKEKIEVGPSRMEEHKPKRQRVQTQPYQAPLPELNFLTKIQQLSKTQDDRLIVFYKGEFLAVRNAEGSFYICQALQNINKNSHRIRIRWLSQEEENNPNRDIYSPDFYDHTDFECILTSLSMERMDRNKYRLPNSENLRTKNILKRALDVESGSAEKPTPTEDNPDGLDVSLFKDEAQLKKRRPVKKKKGSPKRTSSPKRTTPTPPAETSPKTTGTKVIRLPPEQKKQNAVKETESESAKKQKVFRSSRRSEPEPVVDNVQKNLKPKGTISQPKPAAILRGKEKQNIVPKGKKKLATGGKKA